MLASLANAVIDIVKPDLKARLRAMTVSAVLVLLGLLLLLLALGFGLALLFIWLQQELGTLSALAIVAGASALLAMIFFAIAAWRPKPGDKPARRTPAPPPSRPESATGIAATDRMMDEALTAVQRGSREQMLAALSLAVVTGIILGRKV